MTVGPSAPPVEFIHCPPTFQRMRQTVLPAGLRPRRMAKLSFLTIPALPTRPERFRLAFHLRRAWRAATALPPANRLDSAGRTHW